MNGAPVQLRAHQEGGAHVVSISGEIDLSNADRVRREIVDGVPPGTTAVVVDLSGTTYLDSSGIRALFELRAALDGRGWPLGLVVPLTGHVRTVLEITAVTGELRVKPTLGETLGELHSAP